MRKGIIDAWLDNPTYKEGWISVLKRLPEPDEYYLVACNSYCPSGRQVAFLENFGHPNWICDTGDAITEFVTHWQELPNMPKIK